METKEICILDEDDQEYVNSLIASGVSAAEAKIIVALILCNGIVPMYKLSGITSMSLAQVSISVAHLINTGILTYEYRIEGKNGRNIKYVSLKGTVDECIEKLQKNITWKANVYSTKIKMAKLKITV